VNSPILSRPQTWLDLRHSVDHRARDEIFGAGGARKIAERLGIPFLGEIPLETKIRATSDAGRPVVLTDPDSPSAKAFIAAAEQLAAQASIRAMQVELQPQVKVTF